MTATAAQILQVRRMVDEPDTTTYSDTLIQTYIETYPMIDERGEVPYTWDTSTTPPTRDTNDNWIATYDLNAAAADIWEEKAATVAQNFDFSADGGSYSRSQMHAQYCQNARMYRARGGMSTIMLIPSPEEYPNGRGVRDYVINLPEED